MLGAFLRIGEQAVAVGRILGAGLAARARARDRADRHFVVADADQDFGLDPINEKPGRSR